MKTRISRRLLFLTLLLISTSLPVHLTCASERRQPNVILILADDLGWSDTTLYGTTSLYRTPCIQRLAARGMTFTRAYASSPLCSPTRASVLTGLSPARHGITTPGCHLPAVVLKASTTPTGPPNQFSTMPRSVTRLSTEHYTLAEALRDNGYATGHFGKWHLGAEPYSPLEHGFDVDVPHHPGPGPAGSYVAPWKFSDFDHDPQVPDQHLEDRMAQEAIAFIEKHQDKPFFLNYWMFSVHAPFDAKKQLIDKYRTIVDPQSPQRSPTYAAMIESMDDAVGSLLDALDRFDLAANTIIVFASDNGGNMYNLVDGGTATSNQPLRGGKATMYEGGIRGPAIVVAPGVVAPDSTSDAIIQSSDIYPTLLELLSLAPQPNQEFDGQSIVSALQGESLKREAIFTYFPHAPNVPEWLPPSVSVHSGDWKLIRIFHGGKGQAHRYKLFHLREDVGEQRDLSQQMPERVRQLDALIERHLADTNAVVPLPNPKFDSTKYDARQEGRAALKGSGRQSKPARKPRATSVAGWNSGGTCSLSSKQGKLIVTSTGNDPYLSYALPEAIAIKSGAFESLVLHLRMESNAAGSGRIYFKEEGRPFALEHSRAFSVNHDEKPHDYAIRFSPKKPVTSLRIDPATHNGTIKILAARLTDATGSLIYAWDFK